MLLGINEMMPYWGRRLHQEFVDLRACLRLLQSVVGVEEGGISSW